MEINWSLDPLNQKIYYLKIARYVQEGLYQRIRSIILPYLHKDGWFIPDFDLFKDQEFREKLTHVSVVNFTCEESLLSKLSNISFDVPTPKEISSDRDKFNALTEDFFYKCNLFFPDFKHIKSLLIVPTKFGSGSSYFRNKEDNGNIHVTITYRIDKDFSFIFRSMLSTIVAMEMEPENEQILDWRIRKGITDFITFNTTFKSIFDRSYNSPVIEFVDGYKGDIILDSAKYYAKMGYPLTSCFSYKDNTIYYNNEPVLALSNKEIEIMKTLIDHKSQIVSFDKLGEIYWQDNQDKFSLASLAKVIEKLRNSLELNGIPNTYIRTIRKRGYLLYD